MTEKNEPNTQKSCRRESACRRLFVPFAEKRKKVMNRQKFLRGVLDFRRNFMYNKGSTKRDRESCNQGGTGA